VEGVVGAVGPLRVELDAPLEIDRWRPLVQWLFAIPHLVVLYALQALYSALAFVAFFTILFTGRIPDGVYALMAMTLRYQWRVYAYVGFMHATYPPFEFPTVLDDPDDQPAILDVAPQAELQRWAPLYKWFLAIPHYFVLAILGIVACVVWMLAGLAVLFTGRWPEGMRDFLVGVARWTFRVTAYVYLMTDEYPPFSLS
jgi:hypothetical protein